MVAPFETPAARVPKAAGLNCPSCGASIALQAQGWAVSVVCGACGAQLDATDENLRVLQYGERVTATPRIPLGTRGTWKGAPWDVIGFQVVTITVEGTDYSWTEYVCFNPYRGFLYLSDKIVPISTWLTQNLGWIPLFKTEEDASLTGSIFIAGIVVALMVLPIITSVVREVFSQTPPGEKEAALALGGTRWGMIRTVVLPFGKGGIVGGSMLGLGRALGETIAVALLLPQVPQKISESIHILQNGGATVSGFIANRAGADAFTTSGLLAAGLVLFIITLGTNMIASVVVSKSRSGAGVEI